MKGVTVEFNNSSGQYILGEFDKAKDAEQKRLHNADQYELLCTHMADRSPMSNKKFNLLFSTNKAHAHIVQRLTVTKLTGGLNPQFELLLELEGPEIVEGRAVPLGVMSRPNNEKAFDPTYGLTDMPVDNDLQNDWAEWVMGTIDEAHYVAQQGVLGGEVDNVDAPAVRSSVKTS